MTSYELKSDISEKQLEADVAAFLGWCSVGLPFKLVDVDEKLTGADKRLDVSVPIYMQFKKSTGLRKMPRIKLKPRANESKLQRVRRFRRDHELTDDPSLYFQLRKQAKHAVDLQHNVLLGHHRPGISHAIYVAPTILDRARYNEELARGPRFSDPWEFRPWLIHHDVQQMYWLSRFERQPFLRCHVSITPHERVAHHRHYYAFSNAGDDVSWHSPEVLEGNNSLLSVYMAQRVRELLIEGEPPSVESCLDAALELYREFEASETPVETPIFGETPLEKLQSYGKWLKKAWGIRQVLLCANYEDLDYAPRDLDGF